MKLTLKANLNNGRNTEHFFFHSNVLAILTEEKAAKLGIAPQRKAYATLFDREDIAFRQSAKLKLTNEIEEKDKVRDGLLAYINSLVNTNLACPLADKRKAAEEISFVLNTYADAGRKPLRENTALVHNLVGDLQKEACAPYLATLGLTELVQQLKEANDDFLATFNSRADDRFVRDSADKMKEIRPQVDEAYRTVTAAINALYQVNVLVTHDEAQGALLGGLVDDINKQVREFQIGLESHGAGKRSDLPADDVAPGTGGTGDNAPGTDPGTGGSGSGGTDPGTGDDSGDIKTDFD